MWSMKKRYWFTLVEVVLVIVVVSTVFVWIINGVSSTSNYLTEVKQRVIALNLAKEGIEAVYNIRDTNWRKRPEKRDDCRLVANSSNNDCGNWITNWRRTIEQWDWTGGIALYLNGPIGNTSLSQETEMQRDDDLFEAFYSNSSNNISNYRLHLYSWAWVTHSKCTNDCLENEDKVSGEYYRYIAVDWLYRKTAYTNWENLAWSISCDNGWDDAWGYYCWICKNDLGNCAEGFMWWTWSVFAKELRFCSVVFYLKPKIGRVQVCSMLTNFEE